MFVSDGKMDYIKTVAVAVLDCEQNVSFIVFCKLVYLRIIFAIGWLKRNCCCKFGIVNFFLEIFNPRFIMKKIYCSKL